MDIIYVDRVYPTMKYKGYEWSSDSELSLQLGKDEDYVLRARRATIWEFEDYVSFIDKFDKIKEGIIFANSLICKDRSNNKNIEVRKAFLLDILSNYDSQKYYYILNTIDTSNLSELNRMCSLDKSEDHRYFLKFVDYLMGKYPDNVASSLDYIDLDIFHEIIKNYYAQFFIICKRYLLNEKSNILKRTDNNRFAMEMKLDMQNSIYSKICPKEIMELYYILDELMMSNNPYLAISVSIYKKYAQVSVERFDKEMIEIDNMFDKVNEYLKYIDLIDFADLHYILSFSKRFKRWKSELSSREYNDFLNKYRDANKSIYNYIYAGTEKYHDDKVAARINRFIESGEFSILDFYKENFPKHDYSEDLKLVRYKYHGLYSEYEEYLLNNSIKRIQSFVDSKYQTISKFFEKNYVEFEYTKDLEVVKEKDLDLYGKYRNKIENARKERYVRMLKCTEKLKKAIINSNYKLSFLDFLKIYNPGTVENMKNYYNNLGKHFDSDTVTVLKKYLSKITMREYNINSLFKEKITIKGVELKDEDKKEILSYIAKNYLPKIPRVYSEICKLYLSGDIDLTVPFRSSTKEEVTE